MGWTCKECEADNSICGCDTIVVKLTPEVRSWAKMTRKLVPVIKRADPSMAHQGELQILEAVEKLSCN